MRDREISVNKTTITYFVFLYFIFKNSFVSYHTKTLLKLDFKIYIYYIILSSR